MNDKFMRIIVMFDLPVKKEEDRKIANNFRKNLLNDGYTMMQFSIYTRLCNGPDAVEKHTGRLMKMLPERGSVRILVVTDKQFANMKILVGDKNNNEKKIDSNQFTIF